MQERKSGWLKPRMGSFLQKNYTSGLDPLKAHQNCGKETCFNHVQAKLGGVKDHKTRA